MDNVVLTSATHISPSGGEPMPSAIDALVATPLEPVEQTEVDGNFQAHMDVNYQAHDVALATAGVVEKSHPAPVANGLKLAENHRMEIDDGFDDHHPDKVQSCCSMLNKLFLALAIVCFALFLCSIAFIVATRDQFNERNVVRAPPRLFQAYPVFNPLASNEQLLNVSHFNLTRSDRNGLVVVLARRGASIEDILIPEMSRNGQVNYRSIVLKPMAGNAFGSVRFGFGDDLNNQLPLNYPYLNAFDRDWQMHADPQKGSRVRFVDGSTEVIYEFSSPTSNELIMTTIVSVPVDQQLIADPTNNIFFNLRGHGNLNTHFLNLSVSTPININTNEEIRDNPLMQGQAVDRLINVQNYFYKLNRTGLGKNHVATLTERDTKTTMHIFADHTGLMIDPSGMARSKNLSELTGIRLSPRQSASFRPNSIYGPTLIVYPSQAIHTTWWQFEYPF